MRAALPCVAAWTTKAHAVRKLPVALPAARLRQRGKGNDMAKTALLFNYEYCSGCKSCEIACRNHLRLGLGQWGMKVAEVKPFEVGDGNKMEWIYQPVPTKLCDGCEDRVAAGQKPACEHHCLAFCIEHGPIEDMAARAAELGGRVSVFLP